MCDIYKDKIFRIIQIEKKKKDYLCINLCVMSTTEYIQIIIGIGQIIAVAIIPIIVWVLGIKYQNRKAKKRRKGDKIN